MADWHVKYEKLQSFISGHPTIEISSQGTSIPGDVRTEFYEIFDDIRAEYVREIFAAQISEAVVAISKFSEAKTGLTSLLDLKIEVDPNLQFFLSDPVTGLTRNTFPLLLSRLMNKITMEDFEQESNKTIQDSYKGFMREIYLQWCTMWLITMLGPDQAYNVPVPDETHDPHYRESELRPGGAEDIPQIVPAEKISLYGSHYVPMLVPKLVFHSSRLDTYVAIRTDYHRVYHIVRKLHEIIKGMEWQQVNDILLKFGKFNLWPDIGLYLDDNPEQLRILTTYTEVLRPDMILDVWDSADQDVSSGLEMARRHCNVLLPRKETFVISRMPLLKNNASGTGTGETQPADGVSAEQQIDIRVLQVGYEQSGLEPVIACLVGSDSAE